jgi:trehalose 6-phosphate synthase/phosphatase
MAESGHPSEQLSRVLRQLQKERRRSMSMERIGDAIAAEPTKPEDTTIMSSHRLIIVTHALPVIVPSGKHTVEINFGSSDQLCRGILGWHNRTSIVAQVRDAPYTWNKVEHTAGFRLTHGVTVQPSETNEAGGEDHAKQRNIWVGGVDASLLQEVPDLHEQLAAKGLSGVLLEAERHKVRNYTSSALMLYKLPFYLHWYLQLHYQGYCRSVLWPVLHSNALSVDFLAESREGSVSTLQLAAGTTATATDTAMSDAYNQVCGQFADVVSSVYLPGDMILVNDYELMALPEMLRERLPQAPIAFFLHSPFPSSEVYRTLPARTQLLRGLLGADILGFQTQDYLRHFVSCCARICGFDASPRSVICDGRVTKLLVSNTGVNSEELVELCATSGVQQRVREMKAQYGAAQVLIGVDRCEAMAGILNKLLMFEQFLKAHPESVGKVVLLQVVEPAPVAMIADTTAHTLTAIHELVGHINGTFGKMLQSPSSTVLGGPVFLINGPLELSELVSLYAAADIYLLTSHRDGMNLAPSEYVCCRNQFPGSLASVIVSEFAGVAQTLSGAYMVNPFNTDECSRVLAEVLTLSPQMQARRNAKLVASVNKQSYSKWISSIMQALGDTEPATMIPREGGRPRKPFTESTALQELAGSKHTAVIYDYDIVAESPELAKAQLLSIANTPWVNLVITSSMATERMQQELQDIPAVLIAENGAFVRWLPCGTWEACSPFDDCSEFLNPIVPLLKYFTDRTPGSTLEQNQASLSWNYTNCDPVFATSQARDLIASLAEFTTRLPVTISSNRFRIVDVQAAGTNKASCLLRILHLINGDRPLFVGHTTGKSVLTRVTLSQDRSVWQRLLQDAALSADSWATASADTIKDYVQKEYSRLFKPAQIDRVVMIATGTNQLDDELLSMLQSLHRFATQEHQQNYGQQLDELTNMMRSQSINPAMPPLMPLGRYAATRATSMWSLDSLISQHHLADSSLLDDSGSTGDTGRYNGTSRFGSRSARGKQLNVLTGAESTQQQELPASGSVTHLLGCVAADGPCVERCPAAYYAETAKDFLPILAAATAGVMQCAHEGPQA